MDLISTNLQCCDITVVWRWAASSTSRQRFIFCVQCVYQCNAWVHRDRKDSNPMPNQSVNQTMYTNIRLDLCDPKRSRPDGVCDVYRVGRCNVVAQ